VAKQGEYIPCRLQTPKLFESPLHDANSDNNAQRFAMTDPLRFHFSESLVAKLVGACDDSDFGNAEAQNDFPVQALDLEQVD
jgi:hypothetical protein